jgi:hypothetical protein
MYTVLDDEDVAPPTTAPAPSTISAERSRGKVPCASASPASRSQPRERAHRVEEVRENQCEDEHDSGQHTDPPEAAEADVAGKG